MSLDRRHLIIGSAATAVTPGIALAQAPATRAPFVTDSGHIHTNALLGRLQIRAMLDTGGAFHAIDRGAAERIGLLVDGELINVRGVGGNIRGRYSAPIEVTVGGRVFQGVRLAVIDLSSLGRGGTAAELIIGAPIFQTCAVDFDFTRNTFLMTERNPIPPDRVNIPLTMVDQWPTAPLDIGGMLVRATVDIGSDAPIILSPAAARRLNISERNTTTAVIGGVGGREVGRITSAPQVTFAREIFEDVPIQVAAKDFGTDANIGLGILSRFNLWIDLGGKTLLAKGNGNKNPFARSLIGFYAEPEPGKGIRITHVARNGPADEAGLKQGDVITAIDGRSTVNSAIMGGAEGTVLTLTLDNGRTRSLTLKRYY